MVAKGRARGKSRFGSTNNNSRLLEEDVRSILSMIREGEKNVPISKLFNVSSNTIRKIRHGMIWGHISKEVSV